MARMRPADRAKSVFAAVHEVGARAAVDVQVHEAGGERGAVEIDDFGAFCTHVGGGYGRE